MAQSKVLLGRALFLAEPFLVEALIGSVLVKGNEGGINFPAQRAVERDYESGLTLPEFRSDPSHLAYLFMRRVVT
jgi:hypothetical protein